MRVVVLGSETRSLSVWGSNYLEWEVLSGVKWVGGDEVDLGFCEWEEWLLIWRDSDVPSVPVQCDTRVSVSRSQLEGIMTTS